MGSGYAANIVSEISEKDLCKVGSCNMILNYLKDYLEEQDSCLEEYAKNFIGGYSYVDNDFRGGLKFYKRLRKEFKSKTGMDLYLSYHSSDDNGDRYDDINGVYWGVLGHMEVSTNAKKAEQKYKIKIHQQQFVTFG